MSNRLNQEREEKLQPIRMTIGKQALEKKGFKVTQFENTRLEFEYKGETVKFFPYSGWHTGKTIKDGRGLENLLRQLI